MPRGTLISSNKILSHQDNTDEKISKSESEETFIPNEEENNTQKNLVRQNWMLDDIFGFSTNNIQLSYNSTPENNENNNKDNYNNSNNHSTDQLSLREQNIKQGISNKELSKSVTEFKRKVEGDNNLWGSRKCKRSNKIGNYSDVTQFPVIPSKFDKKEDGINNKLNRLYSCSNNERSLSGKFKKGLI